MQAVPPDPFADEATRARELRTVPITRLHPSPDNPRHHLDQRALQDLANTMRTWGPVDPLLVRPIPDQPGHYEIVSGERRYRAAQLAGLPELDVIIDPNLEHDPETAHDIATLANIERDPMNPYEETIALLRMLHHELSMRTPWSAAEAEPHDRIRAAADLLKTWVRATTDKRRKSIAASYDIPEPADIDEAIAAVFKHRDGLRPLSFVKNRLPLLHLHDDVEAALQRGTVHYTAALVISKSHDPEQRQALITLAEQGGSLHEIRQRKAELEGKANGSQDTNPLQQECRGLAGEVRTLLKDLPTLDHNQTMALMAALKKAKLIVTHEAQ